MRSRFSVRYNEWSKKCVWSTLSCWSLLGHSRDNAPSDFWFVYNESLRTESILTQSFGSLSDEIGEYVTSYDSKSVMKRKCRKCLKLTLRWGKLWIMELVVLWTGSSSSVHKDLGLISSLVTNDHSSISLMFTERYFILIQ